MTKKEQTKTHTPQKPKERVALESYMAPAPPSKGKIVGLDAHPDTFTLAVFIGRTPHDAKKIASRENLCLSSLLSWAAKELDPQDIIVMEASANTFALCRRLAVLGLRTCVLESAHVGKHAKTYADNDKMAAARIALVYLAGNAPCVWCPDEQSSLRREILKAYEHAVKDHTAAINTLSSYLNQHCIGKAASQSLSQPKAREWIFKAHPWAADQRFLLEELIDQVASTKARRTRFHKLIATHVAAEPLMLACMKLLGIGIVSAFALLAVIGDIHRFHSPQKLVAYIGLNPGQRQSGRGKDIKLGLGKRGRGDVRRILIQGAHAILRTGRHTSLGQWGWRLFARKGNRSVAVVAVARKLLVQVWHTLQGNQPIALEADKSFALKLQKLAAILGTASRKQHNLGSSLKECSQILIRRVQTMHTCTPQPPPPMPALTN